MKDLSKLADTQALRSTTRPPSPPWPAAPPPRAPSASPRETPAADTRARPPPAARPTWWSGSAGPTRAAGRSQAPRAPPTAAASTASPRPAAGGCAQRQGGSRKAPRAQRRQVFGMAFATRYFSEQKVSSNASFQRAALGISPKLFAHNHPVTDLHALEQ